MCWKNDVYRSTQKAIDVTIKCSPLAIPFIMPALAYAQETAAVSKLSDITTTYKAEAKLIVPILFMLVAAIGVITAAVSVLSAITAKRNSRPLEWQMWGFIGGGLATVIPVFILAASGSISGGKGEGQTVLTDLGL